MTDVSIGEGAPLLVKEDVFSLASGEMGSVVSWAAIIAGAFVASAFALALVALGAGIGLISVSPWSANNPSVTKFGALAAAWFIAVELFACGLGGYLGGRLRTRWARVHDDEVYFRDTAHGLLVWAVKAVFTAALLALSAASALSGAAHLVGAAAQTAATTGEGASIANPTDYFADMMLRADHPPIGDQTPTVMETRCILARALVSGELPDADKTYLATVVFNRTGISTADLKSAWPTSSRKRKALATKRRPRRRRPRTRRARLASMQRSGPSYPCWSVPSRRATWRPSAGGCARRGRVSSEPEIFPPASASALENGLFLSIQRGLIESNSGTSGADSS